MVNSTFDDVTESIPVRSGWIRDDGVLEVEDILRSSCDMEESCFLAHFVRPVRLGSSRS